MLSLDRRSSASCTYWRHHQSLDRVHVPCLETALLRLAAAPFLTPNLHHQLSLINRLLPNCSELVSALVLSGIVSGEILFHPARGAMAVALGPRFAFCVTRPVAMVIFRPCPPRPLSHTLATLQDLSFSFVDPPVQNYYSQPLASRCLRTGILTLARMRSTIVRLLCRGPWKANRVLHILDIPSQETYKATNNVQI